MVCLDAASVHAVYLLTLLSKDSFLLSDQDPLPPLSFSSPDSRFLIHLSQSSAAVLRASRIANRRCPRFIESSGVRLRPGTCSRFMGTRFQFCRSATVIPRLCDNKHAGGSSSTFAGQSCVGARPTGVLLLEIVRPSYHCFRKRHAQTA